MTAAYIRNRYQVPAWRGGRITYTGGRTPQQGTIVGFRDAHLRIRLDGQREIGSYHPTWMIDYLGATVSDPGAGTR
jgi:hypothetical protein